jgi:DNA-binding MarR family transcriptional regulator
MGERTGRDVDLERHLAAVLERIGEVSRALRWRQAVGVELTPLQLRVLGFIAEHAGERTGVARLAEELQVSRPTISACVSLLVAKGLLLRRRDTHDGRSHSLRLSASAQRRAHEGSPLLSGLASLDPQAKEGLMMALMQVLLRLTREGKVQVQRMCWTCVHYTGDRAGQHGCSLLQRKLSVRELRTDCPEHATR